MGYWVKMYTDIIDDPKYHRLPDKTKTVFFELVLLAKKVENGEITGNLPELKDISFHLRRNEEDTEKHISVLIESGILSERKGGYVLTNYKKRQTAIEPKKRMKEYRKKKNADIMDTYDTLETEKKQGRYEVVTNRNGETETETETEYIYKDIVDTFNKNKPKDISSCRGISKGSKRHTLLKARMKEPGFKDNFLDIVKAVELSSFLKGDNDRGWKADFDWLIGNGNWQKVLEGKYKDEVREVKDDTIYR